MILYDESGRKYQCFKTKKPVMNTRHYVWDSKIIAIDGKEYRFNYRYSGNFFFLYDNTWFKTGYDGTAGQDIGFDVFPQKLFTHKIQ